jgi:plastocyanin
MSAPTADRSRGGSSIVVVPSDDAYVCGILIMAFDTPGEDERFANRLPSRGVSLAMKRITGSMVVCAGAGLFTAGALLFNGGGGGERPANPAPAVAAPAAPGGTAATLEIKNFEFSSITAKPGATVTIANRDDAAHTVTADKGGFNVKASGKSSASLRAPAAPGTYPFFCAIHPEMRGTLTVR